MSLEQEIALVTGASRGIGQGIALELGKRGAQVFGTATTDKAARSIDDAFRETGIRGTGMVLDVTDSISIETLIKRINEQIGAPTILVNNAGITRDNLLLRLKDEDWEAVLNTNLGSVFHLSKACLRGMMKARHGRIINIASVVGLTGNPGQTNYAAAKAGMLGFTKSLAREVGSRNITVNAVAPGFIDTDMTRALAEDQRNALLVNIPLGRLGDVSDVANTVAFLASQEAGYITGQTVNVNGGMFMA
jgi:3-oxoacyl-[acyl-carrier protein] reductase